MYSMAALELLKKLKKPYKGYNIDSAGQNLTNFLLVFNKYADIISFDKNHTSKPIIFLNGKFIGGYTELNALIAND